MKDKTVYKIAIGMYLFLGLLLTIFVIKNIQEIIQERAWLLIFYFLGMLVCFAWVHIHWRELNNKHFKLKKKTQDIIGIILFILAIMVIVVMLGKMIIMLFS